MSRTPMFFVERFDENTGKYELQHPIVWNYDHTKQIHADLFPYNGCHDLFDIVEESSKPQMRGIHHGLPDNVSTEIKESYNKQYKNATMMAFTPDVRWFTYADMYIYCLENPKVLDYEAMDMQREGEEKEIFMPTPMEMLKKRVDAFLEVMDYWNWRDDYSLIRIVYWIL
jgi:hypothetical protein